MEAVTMATVLLKRWLKYSVFEDVRRKTANLTDF